MANLPQSILEKPLLHGQLVSIADGVRRLVANNAGAMTGPGTNTYVLGTSTLAVIDPGPLDEGHIELLAQAGDIRWIFVTHTHRDHSPAAMALAQRTGAKVYGALGPADGYQDDSLKPDQLLTPGFILDTAEFTLQAVHTPGHVDNHFCFWHAESGLMFTGDHIMQGSTVVIIPPSGDMHAYIQSVELLNQFPIAALAPGHGHLMIDVPDYLVALVQHRLAREEKVLAALAGYREPVSLALLTAHVYRDVDPALHKIAAYSLWAHLLKLEKDGRATHTRESHWLFDQAKWQLNEH